MSISNVLSTAVSALVVNSARIAASAHNIANVNSDGYLAIDAQGRTPSPVYAAQAFGGGGVQVEALEPSNVDLAREFINISVSRAAYEASAKVIQAVEDMHRDGLDMIA